MKEYQEIELTEDELKEAILEGKKKKYFREKHKDHWQEPKVSKEQELSKFDGPVNLSWGDKKHEQGI